MPREHELKTWPAYFEAIVSGEKTFEVRRDDRGFQKGDVLVLQCWNPKVGLGGRYVNDCFGKPREIRRKIAYVLTGGQFGIEPGFVVMGLKRA